MPNLWAFPEAIATSGASAAFDRLARDVVMRVGIACAALIANVIYLVSTLSASGAASSIVSLYATLTTAVAVGACCALAPLVRREQHLRRRVRPRSGDRLEYAVDAEIHVAEEEPIE